MSFIIDGTESRFPTIYLARAGLRRLLKTGLYAPEQVTLGYQNDEPLNDYWYLAVLENGAEVARVTASSVCPAWRLNKAWEQRGGEA